MAWRDQVKGPATFRGISFFLEASERAGGRRTVRHEYPMRDKPFVEDLGRAVRAFPVDGYVLGDEYIQARDALISALEAPGPGQLVHPYYGRRQCIVVGFRVRESSADGGIARFAIDFEETDPEPDYPEVTVAAAPAVARSIYTATSALEDRLGQEGDFAGPASQLAAVAGVVSAAAQKIQSTLSPIMTGVQEAAALRHGLDNLLMDVASLVRQPAAALGAVLGLFDSLASVPSLFGVRACLAAFGFAPLTDRPPESGPRALYDLMTWALRTACVLKAAELAPSASFDSYDAAIATRNAITDDIDEVLEDADDATFAALEQLRADLVRAVPGEASDLPRLLHYTPPAEVPSLVLAHRLYGDVALEADLVARNRLDRPGFILGGVTLEVLSSGG